MRPNAYTLCAPLVPGRGRILDVGGGGDPFKLATHVLDPYINESPEGMMQRGGRPFIRLPGVKIVEGRGEAMPFPDQHFDFVFCSETLNHCQDPVAVVNEMARVGKAGYIDVPAAIHELFEPHSDHLWRCFELGPTEIGFSPRVSGHPLTMLEDFVGYLAWAMDETLIRQDYWVREASCAEQFYIQFVWDNPEELKARSVSFEEVLPPLEDRWKGGIGEYLWSQRPGG